MAITTRELARRDFEYLDKEIKSLEKRIKLLPEGKLVVYNVNGHRRCYQAYKDPMTNKKVRRYISNRDRTKLQRMIEKTLCVEELIDKKEEYRGLKMQLEIVGQNFILELKNNSSYIVRLGSDIYGNITRIDNVIADMEKKLEENKLGLNNLEQQFENAKIDVKVPFDRESELEEKIKRLNKLNKELEINEKENEIIDDPENEIERNQKEQKSQGYEKDEIR